MESLFEMLAISVSAYSEPAGYQASEVPKPTITKPRDVLIQIHAASINPIDVKKAGGDLKLALKEQYVKIPFVAATLAYVAQLSLYNWL